MRDFKKALQYSFLLLRYRARSKAEVVGRLKKKKCSPSIIKQTTQYLEKNKYINDREFARLFVASCLEKGWGRLKIDFRLKALGISSSLRRQAIAENFDFELRLRQLIEEKADYLQKQKPKLSSKKLYQKVTRFVLSRGFTNQEVSSQIDSLGVDEFEDS